MLFKKGMILLFIFMSLTLNAQSSQLIKNKIDEYLSAGVSNGFSAAVLVAKKGEIFLNKGYGMAKVKRNVQNSSSTIFSTGSVTKQFTATAILLLVKKGKLSLDDTIDRFFKELPKDKRNITIHQLLTHSAGLIHSFGMDHLRSTTEVFFKDLFKTKLLQKPGKTYKYSNTGYSILARIIEIISKKSYEEFLRNNLFIPSGMMQTGYFLPKWKKDNIASNYLYNYRDTGSILEQMHQLGSVPWFFKGNGAIHSTVNDMFKWYQALKNNKILSKSLTAKMTTAFISEQESSRSHYGYGWAIYNSDRNTKIVTHNGGNSATLLHEFIWLPKEDVVIIYFTNSYSREIESVAWEIEKIIFNEDYKVKKINKSITLFLLDFIEKNERTDSNKLLSLLREKYRKDLNDSDILNSLGYRLLEMKNILWAIEIFKLNTVLYSDDSNVWDSLGDGYLSNNQNKEAIQNYTKAVELGSHVSKKKLKELLEKN